MGLYYHIDMNGGPWNDRWINTTTAAKIREQLNLAYQTGIDRIWIINVGDLKPKEMPIDFIMHYAWNPDDYPADKIDQYMVDWARSIFGGEYAREIADIVTEYSKMNLERKPEVQRVGIYNVETGEAQRMYDRWDELEKRTLLLSKKMPYEMQDAFYQLVEYPAVASAGLAKIYLAATMGDSVTMQTLFERDKQMTDKYNKIIAGGKWDGMMLDKHIGYRMWSMPDDNTLPMVSKVKNKEIVEPSETAIMAHDYTRRTDSGDARWTFLPGLGRGKGNMGIEPVTAKSRPDGDGATLEYDVTFSQSGKQKLALGILPTNDVNPARGLRVGIRIDNGQMHTIDARQGYVDTFNEYTKENIARSKVLKPLPRPANDIYLSGFRQPMRSEVFDNLRWLSIDIDVPTDGKHTIKVVMIDPEIVVEKLIINPDNEHPSYHGKE
ncbi:MAG: glycosyl hydrolase 115 family protein [Bacteroidaceae bacterium]|nr:glycosyl hydrolase 115 family protein [Bacteroidaceae bacterium]